MRPTPPSVRIQQTVFASAGSAMLHGTVGTSFSIPMGKCASSPIWMMKYHGGILTVFPRCYGKNGWRALTRVSFVNVPALRRRNRATERRSVKEK